MVSDECNPIGGDACERQLTSRVSSLESAFSILSAQVKGYMSRLCGLEANAIVNIQFTEGGNIVLTRANGTQTSEQSPYLLYLIEQINLANNDTSKIVGGIIENNGDLILIRANNTEINLGNIVSVANPVRGIAIRNDGRIELTLNDGVTTIATDRTIQSAVDIPSGGGGGDGVEISLLGTPIQMALGTAPGQSGSQDIAALSGVTVPVGATHVMISCELQHLGVNVSDNERLANYSTGTVQGHCRGHEPRPFQQVFRPGALPSGRIHHQRR
jgi:hypothetical protein